MGHTRRPPSSLGVTVLATAWTVVREIIIVAAFIGIATSLARWSGNIVVAALQLVAPLTVLASAIIAVAAVITGQPLLAITGAIVVALSLPLFIPKLVPDPSRHRTGAAPMFTVALANLYFDNPEPEDAIEQLIAVDADILVMTELSVDLLDRFDRLGGAARYPSRIHPDPVEGEYAVGIFSQTGLEAARVEQHGDLQLIAATWVGLEDPAASGDDEPRRGRSVEVRAVHPDAPSTRTGFKRWRHQLRELRKLLRDLDGPAIVLGDLNAGTFQVPYERLLSRRFRDAHAVLGKAMKPSWGIAPWLPRWVPTLVARLDHLVISPEIHVHSLEDLDPVGSDHRPFRAELELR